MKDAAENQHEASEAGARGREIGCFGVGARAGVKIRRQQKASGALARRYLSPIVNAGEAESPCLIDTDRQTGAMFQRKYTTS